MSKVLVDREVMQQALETIALLVACDWQPDFTAKLYDSDEPEENDLRDKVLGTITALRDALARPEIPDRAEQLLRENLPQAEWQDKHIHPVGGETHQNWLLKIYLPVPLSATDKSPAAALRGALAQQDDLGPPLNGMTKEQAHEWLRELKNS